MANFSLNTYHFFGTEENLGKFIDKLFDWEHKGRQIYDASNLAEIVKSHNWTGFLLLGSGIYDPPELNSQAFISEGDILTAHAVQKTADGTPFVEIITECRYFPSPNMWKKLIDKSELDIKFSGYACCTEERHYYNIDPWGLHTFDHYQYALDFDITDQSEDFKQIMAKCNPTNGEESGEFFLTEKEAVIWLQTFFNTEINDIEVLHQILCEASGHFDSNFYVCLTPFVYVTNLETMD